MTGDSFLPRRGGGSFEPAITNYLNVIISSHIDFDTQGACSYFSAPRLVEGVGPQHAVTHTYIHRHTHTHMHIQIYTYKHEREKLVEMRDDAS